jgi:hypothetical protein
MLHSLFDNGLFVFDYWSTVRRIEEFQVRPNLPKPKGGRIQPPMEPLGFEMDQLKPAVHSPVDGDTMFTCSHSIFSNRFKYSMHAMAKVEWLQVSGLTLIGAPVYG